MYYAFFHISPWLTLALAVPTAGFVVRLFIIQHDCGHGAYFRARWANETVGWLCSLTTFTPYTFWRRHHAAHHAVWNNLDKRPTGGDIYSGCLTLQEYQALSLLKQRLYRIALHPLVSQILLPPVLFLLVYRVPFDTPRIWRKERRSVYLTNFGIAIVLATLMLLIGWLPVLLVQLPALVLASIVGVWLFSVQHRFEDSLWARQTDWTPAGAALRGSSWLRLPLILQWFTGNIGFHHVHHLLPRVPNYLPSRGTGIRRQCDGVDAVAGASGATVHPVGRGCGPDGAVSSPPIKRPPIIPPPPDSRARRGARPE